MRALLLSAADVDLLRIRLRPLVQLYEELCGLHPENCAREILVVHAWIGDLLKVPPENGWLAGQVSRLRVGARADPSSPPEESSRRFALLFYLDRSLPPGRVDMAQREEMAALDGDLFSRYIQECRKRELGC